jgi:hypothetical protein
VAQLIAEHDAMMTSEERPPSTTTEGQQPRDT